MRHLPVWVRQGAEPCGVAGSSCSVFLATASGRSEKAADPGFTHHPDHRAVQACAAISGRPRSSRGLIVVLVL